MGAIRLQFVAEGDWGSFLIQTYGHGAFSHVDTVLPDGRLLGARMVGGVAIRPPGYAAFSRVKAVSLPVTDEQEKTYLDSLNAELGKPYDFEAIAAFLANRDWRQNNSWYCSEIVAAKCEETGIIPYTLTTMANRITPPDLLMVLSALFPIPS